MQEEILKMSEMSFNPPPPPPPAPSLEEYKKPFITLDDYEKINPSESKCLWARNYPELHWTCAVHKVSLDTPPKKCTYRIFMPQKQKGPTCGLVALSILLNSKVTADDLLLQAKEKNYTLNGEMFSAQNLLDLLKMNLMNGDFVDSKIELYVGCLETVDIINFLLNGGVMLVPYDAWYNHAPCEANGNKAHWALICGIIIPEGQMAKVFGWHGKSLRLAVWDLADLSKSNANLMEFSPKREKDDLEYILPDGGLAGEMGLCNRCILINGFRDEAIKIVP